MLFVEEGWRLSFLHNILITYSRQNNKLHIQLMNDKKNSVSKLLYESLLIITHIKKPVIV
jgi:hypothetical protein